MNWRPAGHCPRGRRHMRFNDQFDAYWNHMKSMATTALTTWKSLDWCSSRSTQMGKTCSLVHWIPFDLISASSRSISLDLTNFDFACMVIDQFLHVASLISHFEYLDLTYCVSTYMVIDQYLHVPSLFIFVSFIPISPNLIRIAWWSINTFIVYLSFLNWNFSITRILIRHA